MDIGLRLFRLLEVKDVKKGTGYSGTFFIGIYTSKTLNPHTQEPLF